MLDSSQTVWPEFGQNDLILAIWLDLAVLARFGRLPAKWQDSGKLKWPATLKIIF
jgi:hypothetical protein